MKSRKFVLVVFSLICVASLGTRTGAQTRVPEHYLRKRGVTRARAITLDRGLFTAPAAGRRIKLDLFADASLSVTFYQVEPQGKGTAWYGKVDNASYGRATFVSTGDSLIGSVTRGDGKIYQIRTDDNGAQWALEIDQSLFPNETDPKEMPFVPAPSEQIQPQGDAPVASDDGSIIDVLVLYTPAARQAEGGTTQMQSYVQLGVAETNQGYVNSGIIQRIRLVEAREVSYTEGSSISVDLARLQNPTDGFLDDVGTIRNADAADLVSLWVATSENTCGIGYELTDPTASASSFAAFGFSVMEYSCAVGNYTFGHEMGHNMGAHHARSDVDTNGNPPRGAYPYAFGYKQLTGNRFRTVMAYDTGCTCPRIDYYSNPDVMYNGVATGADPSSADAADNAMVLNNTRTIVANFRPSAATGPIDTTPPALTITSHADGQSVSTSSITLSGTATDAGKGDNGISSVTVNGTRANNDTATGSGTATWSRTIMLSPGINQITVVAADGSFNLNATTVRLTITSTAAVLSATASTYHVFPQVADGRFSDGTYYRTTLMISNPSATAGANCSLQLRGLTVPGFVLNYPLGPSGWVISPTSGTQDFKSGYATLQCSSSVEAQLLYSYYGANGVKFSEATVFSSPPASITKVIADEREGAQLGLAIANDTDQTANYTIQYIVSATGASGTGSLTLAPRTASAKFLSEFIPGIPANSVSQILVSSSAAAGSIIGLRFTGGVFTTIPESIRSSVGPTASTYHVFPQFADGKFTDGTYYRTARIYLNPSATAPSDCTTRFRGMTIDGVSTLTVTMPPTAYLLSITNGIQAFQSGYATLQCSAPLDALALYSFYAPNGAKLSEATVFSSPSAPRVQILADTREGARVGLAIANDSDQANTYTIGVYDSAGASVGNSTQTLSARSSVAKFIDELVALPANYYGQVIVSAANGSASIIGLRFTGNVFTTIPETIR